MSLSPSEQQACAYLFLKNKREKIYGGEAGKSWGVISNKRRLMVSTPKQ
jgi:hypothetical protein